MNWAIIETCSRRELILQRYRLSGRRASARRCILLPISTVTMSSAASEESHDDQELVDPDDDDVTSDI